MSATLRYGLYGVGRMGRVHGQILRAQDQEIVAVGDEQPVAVAIALETLGLQDVVTATTPEALLAQARLDAVVISSHTRDHARDAAPFVQAGIPVYLEKPLTADLPEAFSFVEQVGTSRHLLHIGLQRRYDEALLHAKQILDGGHIGQIREIRSILRDQYPPPPTYTSRGLIIDMEIHVADEAIWCSGEFPNQVWSRVFEARAYDSPIDEGGNTAHVGFTTPSGIIGRLDLSRTHASGYHNETYVIGTRGTLHVGRFCGYPGPIPVELWTSEGTLHGLSNTFQMTADLPADRAEFQPRFHRAYHAAHQRFRADILEKRPFVVTQNEVLDAQVMVEAAHRSAQKSGVTYALGRSDDLAEYKALCARHGLFAAAS